MTFCHACGTKLPDNAKFCPSCGAELAKAKHRGPTTSVLRERVHRAKRDIAIGWAAVVLGAFIAICGTFSHSDSYEVQTVGRDRIITYLPSALPVLGGVVVLLGLLIVACRSYDKRKMVRALRAQQRPGSESE